MSRCCAWVILPAHAQLFSDSDARKAILELRAKIADQEALAQQKMLISPRDSIVSRPRNAISSSWQIRTRHCGRKSPACAVDRGADHEVATLQNATVICSRPRRTFEKDGAIAVAVDGKSIAVDRGELTAYETALAQFRASDFKGALDEFSAVRGTLSPHRLCAGAHYWIGSSHYALKNTNRRSPAQQILVDRFQIQRAHLMRCCRSPRANCNLATSVRRIERLGA